jgi:hypothetical protein
MEIKSLSKSLFQSSLLLSTLFALTHCGKFGNKDSQTSLLSFGMEEGCLNHMNDQVKRYTQGDISASEWSETFKCVNDNLDQFQKMVRPSSEQGFTQEDIHALANFMMTNRDPFSNEFIQAVFELKSSLLGGQANVLTSQELQNVRQILESIKVHTTELLPYLAELKSAQTPQSFNAIADAIENCVTQISNDLKTEGNPAFSRQSLYTLIQNLIPASDWKQIQPWLGLLTHMKTVLVGGNDTSLNAKDWKELLNTGAQFGSIAFFVASPSSPLLDTEQKSQTLFKLTSRIRTKFKTVIQKRFKGALDLKEIDTILDLVPQSSYGRRPEELKNGIKVILRPLVNRIVKGNSSANSTGINDALTPDRIDEMFDSFEKGLKKQELVKAIFAEFSAEKKSNLMTEADFIKASENYLQQSGGDNEPEIKTMIVELQLQVKTFPGLYDQDGTEVNFNRDWKTFSETNTIYYSWFSTIASKLLKAYASSSAVNPTDSKPIPAGNLCDLSQLINDVRPLLLGLGSSHPETKYLAEKRFREANLFMSQSNGGKLLTQNEVVSYLAVLYSAGNLATRVTQDLYNKKCTVTGMDEIKLDTITSECFRKEYFGNTQEFWKNLPGMTEYYSGLTPQRKRALEYDMEVAARLRNFNERDISIFDIQGFTGVLHYVESALKRFDRTAVNNSRKGFLTKDDVINGVYPVFNTELQSITGTKITIVNKAILLYLTQFGQSPFACSSKPSSQEIGNLIKWVVSMGPFKNFKSQRGQIYGIFAQLSAANPPGCPTKPVPPACQNHDEAGNLENDLLFKQYEKDFPDTVN